MESWKGISGLVRAFRGALEQVPDGGKVVFAGSVGVCSPFVSLLAYAIRDRGMELVYLPDGDVDAAMPVISLEGSGMFPVPGEADPIRPDVLVVMGGLAMEKFGIPIDRAITMVEEIGQDRTLIVGVGFMDIFQRSGWVDRLGFDVLLDSVLDTVKQI